MLEFLNDVKKLLDRGELKHISKIDWDNLDAIAGLRRGANDEILERVIKVMDDIKVKNLTKLADNGFEAMTSGLKFLGKLLARAT
ncbi:MAG: hypothetical protein LBG59_00455 [Candidatus Peribacteria bacterium]|jgi:hypothetical protein|nr:hypothetical protein [Candidatus Peribacteria bacterium]